MPSVKTALLGARLLSRLLEVERRLQRVAQLAGREPRRTEAVLLSHERHALRRRAHV